MGLFGKLGRIPEEGPSFRVEMSCSITTIAGRRSLDSVVECKASENVCENTGPYPRGGGFISFHFISLHIFYEDCRKVTYILVKAALLRGY